MQWFKMFTEARNDAKLNSLTPPQHVVWFKLLCFAAEQQGHRGTISGYDLDLLAVEVAGGDSDILNDTLARLQRLRIITVEDDEITFIHFSERQARKPSDEPEAIKERVQKHRAALKEHVTEDVKRDETRYKRDGNAEEVEEESESETDKEKKPANAGAARAFTDFVDKVLFKYPKNKSGRKPARKIAEGALKRVAVKDRADFLKSLDHYVVEPNVREGFVMDIRRYAKEDWITYLTPADERVTATDSRLTRVFPDKRAARASLSDASVAEKYTNGKYAHLFKKPQAPATKAGKQADDDELPF